jgi:5-methylcytosine-specific restriction endonuclease McrA
MRRLSGRPCPACGQTGVFKGAVYHPACSPRRGQVDVPCVDCGAIRRSSPRHTNARCWKCFLRNRRGAANPNWKGGITPVNRALRNSDQYKAWRRAVFERDGFTCVLCGQHGGTLNADHIMPFATHPELRFDVANGRTLCRPCHMQTPSFLGGARRLQTEAMNEVERAVLDHFPGVRIAAHLFIGVIPGGRAAMFASAEDRRSDVERFRRFGGFAAVVRSVDDALAAVSRARTGARE